MPRVTAMVSRCAARTGQAGAKNHVSLFYVKTRDAVAAETIHRRLGMTINSLLAALIRLGDTTAIFVELPGGSADVYGIRGDLEKVLENLRRALRAVLSTQFLADMVESVYEPVLHMCG